MCIVDYLVFFSFGVLDFFFLDILVHTSYLLRGLLLLLLPLCKGIFFATKGGLCGMRRAARFAEDTAVLKLGVRGHGGLKG